MTDDILESDHTITDKTVPERLITRSGDPALAGTTFSDTKGTTRRPFQGRKITLKGIERTADPRGGAGAPARHGDILGDGDPNRDRITVESVGSSYGNRTLFSDRADAGIQIEGQRSSTEIAIERARRGVVAATERTAESIAETRRKREAKTFDERLAMMRRRTPESMVQPDANQVTGPRVAPKPKA